MVKMVHDTHPRCEDCGKFPRMYDAGCWTEWYVCDCTTDKHKGERLGYRRTHSIHAGRWKDFGLLVSVPKDDPDWAEPLPPK